MQIKILEVGAAEKIPTKKGGSYKKMVVQYEVEGKIQDKTIVSFANPEVFSTMSKALPGQVYDVESTKDEAGYWVWRSTDLAPPGIKEGVVPGSSSGGNGKGAVSVTRSVSKSTYETPEERLWKQEIISRQAAINSAVAAIGVIYKNGNMEVTSDYILVMAEKFRNWCWKEHPFINDTLHPSKEESQEFVKSFGNGDYDIE